MLNKIKYLFILLIGFIFLNPFVCISQPSIKKTRILFLMDASSSMTYSWNPSNTRFQIASNILLNIIDSIYAINNEVEFAVRAYGTQYSAQEKNCYDTKLEVPFNYQNVSQIKTRLQYIKPFGFSPIAYSLQQASENELNNSSVYDYSIIFITDGGESCNGDICSVFNNLLKNKISIKPYVIGLDKNEKLKNYYECLGNFIEVNTAADINEAIQMIVNANRKIIEKPKQLNLVTQYANATVIKDTFKKITKIDSVVIPLKTDISLLNLFAKSHQLTKTVIVKIQGEKILPQKNKAILRFNIEEPIVKIDPPKIERENIQLALLVSANRFNGQTIFNLKAKAISFADKKSALIKFDWQEPLIKDSNVFAILKMNNYSLSKTDKASTKGEKIAFAKNKKATLSFNWEEPIIRTNDGFSNLKIIPVKLLANEKTNPKGVNIPASKNKKATLSFNWEEPIIRTNDVFADLKITPVKFLAYEKTNLKGVSIPAIKNKKATLSFNWEEPVTRSADIFNNLKVIPIKLLTNAKTTPKGVKIPTTKNKKATVSFNWEEPVIRSTDVFPSLKVASVNLLYKEKITPKGVIIPTAKNKKATLSFNWEEAKKDTLKTLLAANYPKRYSYAYRLPNQKLARAKGKATLRFIFDAPKIVAKKDTVIQPKPNSGEMKYKIETKESDNTTIQVFLVGPDGKFYQKAKPLIEIVDSKTKQPITSFNRQVINGEPEILPFTAGTYDVYIREYNVARVYNFPVKEKMLNKIILELEEGTLHFVYGTNLKRPVEYVANVKRRFPAGAMIQQNCDEILKYDPGTYYVEINTLPTFKRSFEIEFFKEYLLYIDEPGTIQIDNTNRVGKIELQCVLGDQFVTFLVLDIKGDLAAQKFAMQPGVYKAIFPIEPAMPSMGKKIIDFKIKSNQTTILDLK